MRVSAYWSVPFIKKQTNDIYQNYQIDNLADDLSVPEYPGTVWLTKQKRSDKDYALLRSQLRCHSTDHTDRWRTAV